METPTDGAVVEMGTVMRHNVRRLRLLRRLSVRELGERLKEIGSPIGASAVTKIEAGSRAVSPADWAALSCALSAPPSAFLEIPALSDRSSWAPRLIAADVAWASGATWVGLAKGVYVHRDHVGEWLGGSREPSQQQSWFSHEDYVSAAPANVKRREQIFRHPVMMQLSVLEGILTEALLGGRDGERIGVTRAGMVQFLTETVGRIEAYVQLLTSEIADGSTPGAYLEPNEADAQIVE